jgi:hypothetical protein
MTNFEQVPVKEAKMILAKQMAANVVKASPIDLQANGEPYMLKIVRKEAK